MSKSISKVSKHISKAEFQKIFDEFQSYHGYMTKLFDKMTYAKPVTAGYLIRAEIPGFDNYIAISFIQNFNDEMPSRFCKAVGIKKVLTGGVRKLNKFIKEHGSLEKFESETILNSFKSRKEILKYFTILSDDAEKFVLKYDEFLDYIKAFENKIKKYYNNDNIKLVVIR